MFVNIYVCNKSGKKYCNSSDLFIAGITKVKFTVSVGSEGFMFFPIFTLYLCINVCRASLAEALQFFGYVTFVRRLLLSY